MQLRFALSPDSPWSRLAGRLAGVESGFTLTDQDDAPGPRLVLHRAATGRDEIGFFLEDADATIVEISAAPGASRELASAAWQLALEVGLRPVRLGAGQASVLTRLISLHDDVARLAVKLGHLLEQRAISSQDLDLLLRYRWPDREHPFEALNALDPAERADRLEAARIESGRAHLPAPLRRDLQAGRTLAERRIECRLDDDVARLRIVRPHALNALDPDMLDQLVDAWDEVDGRARVVVLESEGHAFMAGVDLDRILRWMEADRLDLISGFVERAHRFLERVDASRAHTIARVDGFAVGAGAEFCCAFDTVIASETARIGFPELGLSIYPAMGGTQRLPRRIGLHRARAWILGAGVWSAGRAREFGLVDEVVAPEGLDAAIRARFADPGEGRRAARVELATDGPPVPPPRGRPWLDQPTVASRIATDLIECSRRLPLADGMAEELSRLAEVYRTPQALAGLRFARRSRRV